MKKRISSYLLLLAGLSAMSCADLNVEPRSIVSESAIFSSVAGIETYLITCYNHNRVDDFTQNGMTGGGWSMRGLSSDYVLETTEETSYGTGDYYKNPGDGNFGFWNYNYVRECNYFLEAIDQFASNYGYTQEQVNSWKGEMYFLRGNIYFNMVKRYGGLPLVDHVISQDTPVEEMQIARSTEYETWKFVCQDFAKAAELLPAETGTTKARASKGAAYAMLSRAALYAGTIAKYNDKYQPWDSSKQLQGIEKSHAEEFLKMSYDAACEVESLGLYELDSDYGTMFSVSRGYSNNEYIMLKEWLHITGEDAHGFVSNSQPRSFQLLNGYGAVGYNEPTLNFVDMYEDIEGGPSTRGLAKMMYVNGINESDGLIEYADPADLFKNKDPRLAQTVILPFSQYLGYDIVIRKGLRNSSGDYIDEMSEQAFRDAQKDGYVIDGFLVNGVKKYSDWSTASSAIYNSETGELGSEFSTKGAAIASYDGINPYGTASGFYARKFTDESVSPESLQQRANEVPFPIIRYGEVLLNKAEAAVELGGSYITEGLKAINEIRSRAGISNLSTSDFTVDNVRKERQIELGLEQHSFWDYKRWRYMQDFHVNSYVRCLWPYLDYNKNVYVFREGTAWTHQWNGNYDSKWYYYGISSSEISKNPKLEQNYGY